MKISTLIPNKTKKLSLTLAASAVVLALSGCGEQNAQVSTSTDQTVAVPNSKITSDVASIEFVRNVEGIDEYIMSNGMKVLLYPDPAQSKTLVNITYRVGSVHEGYGETGMAHLLEHMLFKGTNDYKAIDKEFNTRGMRANATTWLDRTNYYEAFEFTQENLDWALGMEASRMVDSTFTEEQLKSEMTVVRNEMERGENSPGRILGARMSSTAYLWHNYANSTIGARSDVENFPFAKLRRFYDKHYRPDNAVLTVAGRFDKEATLKTIQAKFGVLAQPSTPIEKLYTVEPVQDGDKVVNLRRRGEVPVISLQYHIPPALHSDTPAIQMLSRILGDRTTGRLQKSLIETGLATSQGASSYLLNQPGPFSVTAQGIKGQDTAELEAALIAQMEQFKDKKITAEEVAKAKTSMLKETEDGLRNVLGVGSELSEYIAMGDYRFIFYFRDLIEKVTAEDVQRVAEKYFVRSNRTLGRFIPTDEPVRAEITTDESFKAQLANYKGRKAVEAGEVYDNTVANVKARLEEFTWTAGTTVSVYPKKLRAGQVIVSMDLPTGTTKSLAGFEKDFAMIAGLLYSGNAKYSKEEIAAKLDELKASVSVNTGTVGKVTVSISALKEHLEPTLDFVAELLSTPTFANEEIEIDRKALIAGAEAKRSDPASLALATLLKSSDGNDKGHPLSYKTIDEQVAGLKAVTRERLQRLHKSHFTVANGHVAVVGDVNPSEFSALLESKFGSLNGDAPYEKMEDKVAEINGIDSWVETPGKANSSLFISHRLDLNKQHEDYHAAVIANAIWGGSGFASRLMQRIRVKEGYSYGTSSGFSITHDKPHGLYYMRAIAAPENMKKVVAAYNEEVEKVLTAGFSQKEVDDAIAGQIKNLRSSWASEGHVAGVLIENKELNRSLDWFTEYEQKLSAVTLEQANAAFKKYIAREQLNIFTAGDFAKSAK